MNMKIMMIIIIGIRIIISMVTIIITNHKLLYIYINRYTFICIYIFIYIFILFQIIRMYVNR